MLGKCYYTYISLKSSKSLSYIAKNIGRSESTISHEIKCNKGLKGYPHKQTQSKYRKRQANKISTHILKYEYLNYTSKLFQFDHYFHYDKIEA